MIDAIEPGFAVVVVVVGIRASLRFDITDSLPTSDTLPFAFALLIIPYYRIPNWKNLVSKGNRSQFILLSLAISAKD